MNKFRFLEWEVYKDSKTLFSRILTIARILSKEHRYELGDQLTRSGLSIVLNIAEGSGKSSDKELNRFIEVALGSVYETLAALDVLRDNNFISEEEFRELHQMLDSISNQLGGFKRQIASSVVSRGSLVVGRKSEHGVSLFLAFMIMSLILGIAFGINALLRSQISLAQEVGQSMFALGAADAGIEKISYDAQKGIDVLAQCPEGGSNPECSATLANGSQYVVEVQSPGPGCPAANYCVKSVGSYKTSLRAIRITR